MLQGCDGRSIRVLDTVAPDWERIAIAIGLGVNQIGAIAREHPNDVHLACLQVFGYWLTDECTPDPKPTLPRPTWRALHEVLLHAEFNCLAQEIEELLGGLNE